MSGDIEGLPDNEDRVIPVDDLSAPLPVTLIQVCHELRIKQAELVRRILYGRGKDAYPMHILDGRVESLQFVPGHVWGREPRQASPGPRFVSDVMIIDKVLDRAATDNRRVFSGESGKLLSQLLLYAGHEQFHKYYVTTLLKTRIPDSKAAYKAFWTRDQLHLLQQELFLVRPKYLLLLGAEVAKAVIGTNVKVSRVEHLVHDLTFTARGQEPLKVKACVAMRPEALVYARDDYQRKKVVQQLAQFAGVIGGKAQLSLEDRPPGHVVIDDESQIIEYFKKVRRDSKYISHNLICVDCEWEGEHPQTRGAFLRCVQVSGRAGQAVTIAITNSDGTPRLKVFRRVVKNGKTYIDKSPSRMTTENAIPVLVKHIQALLKDRRLCGHQIKADLEWLEYIGADLKENLKVPENPEDCHTQGPMDTLLAAHAYDEQADLGLDDQVFVHLPHIPKYTEVLDKHIEEHCKRNKISKTDMRGYGYLDDEPLYYYAGWDVDAGIQLAMFYRNRLKKDAFGNSCWRPYHISINAMYGAYEITKVGLQFNKEQADKLTLKFMRKRADILARIRQMTNWPTLNPESTDQMRELLFGVRYNAKPDGARIRPEGALTLNAVPLMSTGKYQRAWSDIQELGEEYKYKVSCNRTVLGLLLLDAERLRVRRFDPVKGLWKIVAVDATKFIQAIRDYRLVSQQLKGPLRPPTDPPPELDDWDPDEPYYEKGIPGSVCEDGKVRTTILMTKETGRWSSIKPPLQNLSSAAEKQLEKLFGAEEYPGSVKLMLEAEKDYFLVAADIGGAELRMTAVQSQDQKFIDATERLSLPEEHPDHLDIHGGITVSAFSLPCRPTKSAIEAYGRDDLRTGAKTVIFGKFYGQSVQASVIAVRQRGVHATYDQLQAISDKFDETYPDVADYFKKAMQRVYVGYSCSWAGRYRRFPITSDQSKVKALQREALNAGIQGGVADYVSKCIPIALRYRDENKLKAYLVLQKHDELMFMVHKDHLKQFCMEGVPYFMRDALHFWAADFDGVRIPGTPDYKFFYDLDVMRTWGKKIKGDELKALGIQKPN